MATHTKLSQIHVTNNSWVPYFLPTVFLIITHSMEYVHSAGTLSFPTETLCTELVVFKLMLLTGQSSKMAAPFNLAPLANAFVKPAMQTSASKIFTFWPLTFWSQWFMFHTCQNWTWNQRIFRHFFDTILVSIKLIVRIYTYEFRWLSKSNVARQQSKVRI